MNETGMVTLNGGDVKSVDVIYHGNGGDAIDGDEVGDVKIVQRIVTDTNNTLVAPTYYRSGYQLIGWNTREDGLGKTYQNGQVVKQSADLNLYAVWQLTN